MKQDSVKILSENMKRLREERGLSVSDMAEILGVGASELSKLESGILPGELNVDLLFRVEREFGVEPYRILGYLLS